MDKFYQKKVTENLDFTFKTIGLESEDASCSDGRACTSKLRQPDEFKIQEEEDDGVQNSGR